jgi:hypothetical protein
MPGEIAQAIRSVAWLIGELEEETVAEATRSMVNNHIDLLNIETKIRKQCNSSFLSA